MSKIPLNPKVPYLIFIRGSMILEELKIILSALTLAGWEDKKEAIRLIQREINLKTMDPRKSKEDDK